MAEDTEVDISIETLTGTIYELRISIFETILGIKARIQRLEGLFIPCTAGHNTLSMVIARVT